MQSAVENQLRLVKAGKDLSALDRIPNPAVPMPPQLGMMLMRPGFYHPMMSVPRAPFGMPAAGMMDPSLMMNKPHPPAQAPVSSMVGCVIFTVCSTGHSVLFRTPCIQDTLYYSGHPVLFGTLWMPCISRTPCIVRTPCIIQDTLYSGHPV